MSFELESRGEGTPVLFLPGSYSTPRAWSGVLDQLDRLDGWQKMSVSLPGYGSSRERRDPQDCRMADLVAFVEDVAAEIGRPFHLIGHSFGGQIALAAALEGRLPVLSLATFEANPIYARSGDTAFDWRQALDDMIPRFKAAVEARDPEAAGIIIDYYCGPGVFAAMPEQIRAFCAATAASNVLDWYTAQDFSPLFRDFAAVSVPVTLCRGARANAAIRDVTAALAAAMPHAWTENVEGADHFLISTHPEDCARIIAAHLARASGG
ncbi:alpha/beta fold hydrolase [Antarctobacter jejuensis]|uniref:alpha/beta fold hydrolase n=1 Tax=Antarctobacter jejuensis TaxID=1439938 RepID=UPI003FD66B57